MASNKMYAYSRFDVEKNEWGQPTKSIMPGDEVSQSDLDVSDEEWNELVQLGVVSSVPHPAPEHTMPGESPNETFARQDAAYAAGQLSEDEAKAVEERQEAQKVASASDVHAEAAKLATAGDDEAAAQLIEDELAEEPDSAATNPKVAATLKEAEKK